MGRERKSIQVGVMDIMRAITTSLTLASLLLVGLLNPSLAQPTAILGRKEDVMVWVLAFEISLALIIAFVVLRWVGRTKISQYRSNPSQLRNGPAACFIVATLTGSSSPMSIMKVSRAGGRPPSCSPKMRPAE